jgi:thioredoxin reductase
MNRTWDCIVVGGGAAGLSAALVLGRARRRTLVVDRGDQSNRVAHGIGGLLGHDGRPPAEFYAAARAELASYPSVELRSGEVVGGERREPGGGELDGAGFVLELADGSQETARRVLLATGMDYRHPELPGIAERWGRSVFHCPFCHGWEVRERPLGVLGGDETGVERALLLRMWSDDVTLFTEGQVDVDLERLRAAGVAVEERQVVAVRDPGSTVVFADGGEQRCDGLLVPAPMHQRSPLAEQLGAELAEPGPAVAGAVQVDPMFATAVPGLAAAGDVAPRMPSVANAIAAGASAAAAIVRDAALSR